MKFQVIVDTPGFPRSLTVFRDLSQFVWEIVWPFSKKSALNQALLDRSFGTVWYFANGHIPVGSRKFTPGPGPADVTTLKPSNPE